MVNQGLLVRLETKPGRDADMQKFLQSALPVVRLETGTTAWFAIRFGRSEYGIFDVFPDEAAREIHLAGPVAKTIMDQVDTLFAKPPEIHKLQVLADMFPGREPREPDTKALLLTFKAKTGRERQVEQFLRDAKSLAKEEPKTTAWFAIHLDDGNYGIFDVFPDNGGRFAHLAGRVPRELTKHALSLLGSMPDMDMLNVIAEKIEIPPLPRVTH